tara:strand:- start:1464 stop:2120 length:657 start_codon:yes stop_codon:yes gene_type:complete
MIPTSTRKRPKQVAGNLPVIPPHKIPKMEVDKVLDWNEFKKDLPPKKEYEGEGGWPKRDEIGKVDTDFQQRFWGMESSGVETGVHDLDAYFNTLLEDDDNGTGTIPSCVRSIAAHLLNLEWELLQNYATEHMDTPWDADEWNQCSDLVATMGWEDRLTELAHKDGEWAPFVEHWVELCHLYANGREDELDDLLNQCQYASVNTPTNFGDNEPLPPHLL